MMNLATQQKSIFSSFDFCEIEPEKVLNAEKMELKIKEDRAIEIYKNSGIPKKFFNESFETFRAETPEEKSNLSKAACFADNPLNRILIFCGKNGTGKTHLACGIIRKCGGHYVTAPDLCVEYESSSDYQAKKTKAGVLKTYVDYSFLVIDECGRYILKPDTEKFLLSYIVCNRYENDLPTVLITNSSKSDLIKFLGAAVYDRLSEVCTTVDFTGESKRILRRV